MKDYRDWDVLNREFSQEERDRLAKSGEAMPDGSFPIVTKEDLSNAIQAVGRASDPEAAKRHIKKRAKALGAEDQIPDSWNAFDPSIFQDRLKRPLARATEKRVDWYRIKNEAGQTPKLYIYDEIGYFGHTAKGLADDLAEVRGQALDVHLNSPGGDVFDGLAIYQALKSHGGDVTVYVDGLAASIASVIAMAGSKVIMASKASMMIHDGWSMAVGNAAEMRKAADLLDKQSDVISSVYADRTGQPADFWRDRMREETWYTAQEAVDAGLADAIEGQDKKADDPFDLTVFAHAGRDKAPEPALKPQLKAEHGQELVDPPADPQGDPKKVEEPEPFAWDFRSFQSAIREGFRG